MPAHRTWIEIDQRALASNIASLRSVLAEGSRLCAVLKANAYGHGQKEVAQICSRNGIDVFAVDSLDDALALRAMFPSATLIVLGYVLHERLEEAVRAQIDLTVYDRETIRVLESIGAAGARKISIHLKIETGTHRQGVMPDEMADLLDLLGGTSHVEVVGVSTHFANVEDTTDTRYATSQLTRFQEAVDIIRAAGHTPRWVHCACSAAVILYPETHNSLVRTGIALYGIWPSSPTQLTAIKHMVKCDLTPVLTWKTRIAQVKMLPAGVPIGYGLTETTRRPTRLAVLPVGYWDGYDRGLSIIGEVLIAGARCKIIGRICMNMMMVDVSSVPNAAAEQEVVLIGISGRHRVTADELAAKVGTISYEILTRINPLLPRLVM